VRAAGMTNGHCSFLKFGRRMDERNAQRGARSSAAEFEALSLQLL
jgi:hypothetical protein